jgi:hypothetical protein
MTVCVIAAFACAGCAPQAPIIVPTVVELPTQTPETPTTAPSRTPSPANATALIPTVATTDTPPEITATADQTLAALIIELTLESAELATAAANATQVADAALAVSATPDASSTATHTATETAPAGSATYVTFTPSDTLDVTYTPAPSRTATATGTPAPQGLELLALLSAGFTVLPPEIRYNPATQTALAVAVTNAARTGTVSVGTPTTAQLAAATFPPTAAPILCALPPPTTISSLLSGEPNLLNQLGCPIGSTIQISAASQPFQNGAMIYVSGAPGDIFALTNDGRFRRYPDTWVSGVDPDSAGLTPPPGLVEPIRGFGKVWRSFSDVGAALGWATAGESGATAALLLFERGRALFLPQRNESILLITDAGTLDAGTWRSLIGAF